MYFEQMRRYQEQNELKMKALSNYMGGEDVKTLAKRDELQYMKAVAEKEEQARRKEEREQRTQMKTKSTNRDGLDF